MNGFLDRCASYRESLCLLASGAVPGAKRAEIEAHLAECAACRRYYDEVRNITTPLRNWEQPFAHVEPNQAAVRRWQNAIRAVDKSQPAREYTTVSLLSAFWHDWVRPFRFAWGGMAALWLVMAGANFGLSRSQPMMTHTPTPTPAMLQAFEEQRQLLVELVAPATDPVALPQPNNFRPRSQRLEKFNSAQIPSPSGRSSPSTRVTFNSLPGRVRLLRDWA